MEADASARSASYSKVRDALDNELNACRGKLQRDIRKSHRRWNGIENEARLRLAKRPMSAFTRFDKPNTSTTATPAKTRVFSPYAALESASLDYHLILASSAFEVQTPVPEYRHCHSIAYNLRTRDHKTINLPPEGASEDEAEQRQESVAAGKYLVLGFDRSYALAEQSQRIWYFESSITRFMESLGLNLLQIHDIMQNQSDLGLGRSHASGSNPNVLAISSISRAVSERCKIPLDTALSYWLRLDVEEVARYCRICKK
jgi:hypothetical protein